MNVIIFNPPAWTENATCAEIDPDLFFPDKGGSTAKARAICATCPVRELCLDYALAYESGAMGTETSYGCVGIYGGKSPMERRAILRARREESAA